MIPETLEISVGEGGRKLGFRYGGSRLDHLLSTVEREALEDVVEEFARAVRPDVWHAPEAGDLKRVGEAVASVLPVSLAGELSQLVKDGGRLRLVTEDATIPWELCKVGFGALCEQIPVGRLPGDFGGLTTMPGPLRALVVTDPDGLAPWGRAEAALLSERLSSLMHVDLLTGTTTRDTLEELLHTGMHGLVHVSAFADPDLGIAVAGGTLAHELFHREDPYRARLVVLNLAWTAPPRAGLMAGAERFARALLGHGVAAVVVTAWSLESSWVGAFYERLAESDLGQAVRGRPGLVAYGDLSLRLTDLLPICVQGSEDAATLSGRWRPDYRLVVVDGPERGREIPVFAQALANGRALTLGRPGPRACDVELDDPSLDNLVASLEMAGGKLHLVNLTGDPAGVTANGLPVADRVALDGWEQLRLGETVLEIHDGRKVRAPAVARSGPESRFCLSVVRGVDEDTAKELVLGQGLAVVGRHSDCQLQITDRAVSRRHLSLVERDGFYYASRIGSVMAAVNGVPLEGERQLRHGDLVQLSDETMLRFIDRVREGPGARPGAR